MKRILHLAFGRRGLEREIDEEIAFHVERTVTELENRGMTPAAARLEAARRFGDMAGYRKALTALGSERRAKLERTERMEVLKQNLAYAWRGAVRSPGFTLMVALTLGLGVGANAAMFGIIDRLLLRAPDHIANSDAVRRLFVTRSFLGRMSAEQEMTWLDTRDLAAARSFDAVAVYSPSSLTFGEGERARKLPAVVATPDFFPLLGVTPAVGRFFTPAEDSMAAGSSVVVLGYRFWQREFGGDRSVIGRSLAIGKGHYQVVGVAPDGFTGVDLEGVDLWLPLHPAASEIISGSWETSRGFYWLNAVARLRPGVSDAAANAEATALHRQGRINDRHYDPKATIMLGSLIAARGPNASSEGRISIWLAGVALVVLLIACANVANLLLVRAIRRRREIAVRLALGVSRGRLVGHLLTESLLLATLGGAGALVLAGWGGQLLRKFLLPQVAWGGSVVTGRIALFTMAAALLAGVLAGLIPAVLESRPDLIRSLRAAGGGGSRRSRLQTGLMIFQATLSVVLLVGAGLFVRSLDQVKSLDLGMQPDKVLLLQPEFSSDLSDQNAMAVFERARGRIASLPSVEQASISTTVPFLWSWAVTLKVPGLDSLPRSSTGGPYLNAIDAGYFAALGTRLISGRAFTPEDRKGSAPVTIVGAAMARKFWPGQSAIGKCMKIGGDTMPCSEIVGVVEDARRQDVLGEETLQYYVPIEQAVDRTAPAAILVRPRGPLTAAIPEMRRMMAEVAPELRYLNIQPLQDLVDPQLSSWRLGAVMFTLFGGLALLVAAVGLYSLMACHVAQRTQEIGVRSALGASMRHIVTLVVRDGVVLILVGMGLGAVVALLTAPAVEPFLFGVTPRDPLVFGLVLATLFVVALLASAIPAWRASRVNPLVALKAD
ncbi:MAG: ABC transporter permease [Gemmatimonadota bacterium]